jgi:tetratricopeptide (TPR) repeat protein/tRNA A-37 threonylcarbamoyl transferase component Bud32
MLGDVFSNYRLVEELGQGGMGIVYRAVDTTLDREVAIKFPRAKPGREIDNGRILEEARAASALNHPNIAAIYHSDVHRGQPYIVMELVDGPTLKDLLRDGPLSPERALTLAEQTASALAAAHDRRIVHRDIKPANIRLTAHETVKVLDFGLAQRVREREVAGGVSSGSLSTETVQSAIEGSVGYMSPEQARGKLADGRSDVFSLGAVLYECLTGQRAFSGASNQDVIAATLREDPPPPSAVASGITPEMDALVMRMLSKDRNARPTAAEALAEIRALRAGTASSARVSVESGAGWRRGVFAAALACLLALAGWAAYELLDPAYRPSAEARYWFDQGVNAIRNGSFLTAQKALRQAVEKDGRFRLARARLAEAYAELDDVDRAREELLSASGPMANGRLDRAGRLQFDAIHASLANDFNLAAAKYKELLQRPHGAARADVLVDLGRIYEKMPKPQDAIAAYEEAAKLQPQFAAAFLRLGVLYGRKGDPAKAVEDAFSAAEALYRASSNAEGLAEVDLHRAMFLDRRGMSPEALRLNERALATARQAGNVHQEVRLLLEVGRIARHMGEPERAAAAVERAAELARTHSLETFVANGLFAIGNALLQRGDLADAETHYRQALEAARRSRAQGVEARALFQLAGVHAQQKRLHEAEAELAPALAFFRKENRYRETGQCLILLGRLKRAQGDMAGARQAFEETRVRGERAGDLDLTGLAHEGLATLALRAAKYPEALFHYRRRYELGRRNANVLATAYGLSNAGKALIHLGRTAEAEGNLRDAATAAQRGGLTPVLNSVSLDRARIALFERRFADVRALTIPLLYDAVVEYRVEAMMQHGLACVFAGEPQRGFRLLEDAGEQAQAAGSPMLSAQALSAHAQALSAAGRWRQAKERGLAAAAKAAESGAHDPEWYALAVAAKAALALKDSDAEALRVRAQTSLAHLLDGWAPADAAAYLKRPDVARLRGELRLAVVGAAS